MYEYDNEEYIHNIVSLIHECNKNIFYSFLNEIKDNMDDFDYNLLIESKSMRKDILLKYDIISQYNDYKTKVYDIIFNESSAIQPSLGRRGRLQDIADTAIDSGKKLGHALRHPIETTKRIYNEKTNPDNKSNITIRERINNGVKSAVEFGSDVVNDISPFISIASKLNNPGAIDSMSMVQMMHPELKMNPGEVLNYCSTQLSGLAQMLKTPKGRKILNKKFERYPQVKQALYLYLQNERKKKQEERNKNAKSRLSENYDYMNEGFFTRDPYNPLKKSGLENIKDGIVDSGKEIGEGIKAIGNTLRHPRSTIRKNVEKIKHIANPDNKKNITKSEIGENLFNYAKDKYNRINNSDTVQDLKKIGKAAALTGGLIGIANSISPAAASKMLMMQQKPVKDALFAWNNFVKDGGPYYANKLTIALDKGIDKLSDKFKRK